MTNQELNSCYTRSVSTSELIAKILEQKEKSCDTRKVNPLELIRKEEKQEQESTSEAIKLKLLELKKSIEYNKLLEGSALGLTAYLKPASGIPFSDLSSDTQDRFSKLYLLVLEIKVVSDSNVSSEEKQRWNQKQDKILDLEKIRMGASFGLTSLQSLVLSDWTETDETSAAFIKNKPDLPDTISSEQKITLKFDVDDEEIPIFKDESNNVFDHTEIKEMFDDNTKNVELLYSRHFYSLIRHSGSKYEFASYDISGSVLYLEFTFSDDAFSVYENSTVVDFMKYASMKSPKMDGNATVGISNYYSREDHVHPSDTSRVPITRKINNKPLSSDITLTANDVGALPSTTVIPDAQILADWEQDDSSKKDYIKNKPTLFSGDYNDLINKPPAVEIPEFNVDRIPTENSTNLVESGGVYSELLTKAPKLPNTIYVTLDYWLEHKDDVSEQDESRTGAFLQDNTHYILATDLYDFNNISTMVKKQYFGKGCTLSACKGCRFGYQTLYLDDTFIDVSELLIFRLSLRINPANPSGGFVSGNSLGTVIKGTIINRQILPEWWGAKSGRGVLINDDFHNVETEYMANVNANAINEALLHCDNENEVYCPGAIYMVGGTIVDLTMPTQDKSWPVSNVPPKRTRLHFAGSVMASDEFKGYYENASFYHEIPAIIYVGGSSSQSPVIHIDGDIIVPNSAQDKTLSIVSSIPQNQDLGTIYLIKGSNSGEYNTFDAYTPYFSYKNNVVMTRKIGKWKVNLSTITSYINGTSVGGSNTKFSGMYGLWCNASGADVRVGNIVKGDGRAGWNNVTYDGKLMTYRYRREVMHQGQCTGFNSIFLQSSNIQIGHIVGFNDGFSFDRSLSSGYPYVLFNRVSIGTILANNAIHIVHTGKSKSIVYEPQEGLAKDFNGVHFRIGGNYPFRGGDGFSETVFMPMTSKSTFLLAEGDSPGGFNNVYIEFDTSPLLSYTAFVDIVGRDNHIVSHGNSNGDLGRVLVWTKSYGEFGRTSSGIISVDGDEGWFLFDTFEGGKQATANPYCYPWLAALEKKSYNGTEETIGHRLWYNGTGYGYGGKLAPWTTAGKLETSGTNLPNRYKEWEYPYSSTRSFINFREASSGNIIEAPLVHLQCYDAVYADTKSDRNELRNCQSRFAMFEDNEANSWRGHWTIFNGYLPFFEKVVFDTKVSPIDADKRIKPSGEQRIMMYPDANTLSSIKHVLSHNDIDDTDDKSTFGLYVIDGEVEIGTSAGPFKVPRYPLYVKFKYGEYILGVEQNDELLPGGILPYGRRGVIIEHIGWIAASLLPQHIKTINGQSLIGDGNINLNESFNLPEGNQTVGLVVFGKFENEEFYSGVYDEESSPQWEFSETPYTRLINTLYVDITNNKLYRYNGTQYVEASSDRGISVNQEILNIENY